MINEQHNLAKKIVLGKLGSTPCGVLGWLRLSSFTEKKKKKFLTINLGSFNLMVNGKILK
jgi:ribosomal 30S subunit maturation factor RimM